MGEVIAIRQGEKVTAFQEELAFKVVFIFIFNELF